jgi:hypothetical protein
MKKALAAVLAAATLSCADNNASVQFQAICAPPDDGCTFAETCDAQYIGLSQMDVGVTDRLWLTMQFANQLLNNADPDTGRANTNDAQIREFRIEYDAPVALPDASVRVGPFRVPASGNAVVSVFPIPAEIGALLRPAIPASVPAAPLFVTVVARVRALGIYDNQSSFETAEYEVPVQVCNGCLGTFAVCPDLSAAGLCPPNDGQLPVSQQCQ